MNQIVFVEAVFRNLFRCTRVYAVNYFLASNSHTVPPCPPQDVPVAHHYAFELFALDQKLDLPATATRADVLRAMDGHITGHATIVAPFNRQGRSA